MASLARYALTSHGPVHVYEIEYMYSTCVLYDGPVLVVIAHMSCTEIGMALRPKMLGIRPDGGRRDGAYS